ncbi:MAG: serine/threonine protein kinase [Coriobacteriia bacterium]|nr:serine/threonine protein kinase [Coriobacteriia bacterium]
MGKKRKHNKQQSSQGEPVKQPQSESEPQAETVAGPELEGLARYEIDREIGRGAMGVVYLASDTQSGTRVALKELVIPENTTPEKAAEMRGRFDLEAEVAGALDSENIVKTLGSFSEGERHFIVMEYVEGESLDEVLKRGPLPWEAAIGVATQMLAALEVASAAGVVHRDLKPANVFVTPDGGVKVADFGVARLDEGAGLTVAGQVVGTVGYMSPEQIRGDELDARSDIFAIGIILHEALIGSNPFHADQPTTTMYRLAYEDVPPLDPFIEGLPAFVTPVIRKATAKETDLRYQSAAEMLSDLETQTAPDIAAIEAAAVARAANAEQAAQLKPKRKLPASAKWIAVGVAALLLVAGVSGAAWYSYKQKALAAENARKAAIIVEGKAMAADVARLKGLWVDLKGCVSKVKADAARNERDLDNWDKEWAARRRRYSKRVAEVESHNAAETRKWEDSYTVSSTYDYWYGWQYSSEYTYETNYWDFPSDPKKPAKVKVSLKTENRELDDLVDELNAYRSDIASATPRSRFFGPVYQVLGTTAQSLSDSVDKVRTMMAGVVSTEARGQKISSAKVDSVNLGSLDAPFQQIDQQVTVALATNRLGLNEILGGATDASISATSSTGP